MARLAHPNCMNPDSLYTVQHVQNVHPVNADRASEMADLVLTTDGDRDALTLGEEGAEDPRVLYCGTCGVIFSRMNLVEMPPEDGEDVQGLGLDVVTPPVTEPLESDQPV